MQDKHITFALPEPFESVSTYRRDLLCSIRKAIQQAQIDGHIDVEASVNALRALAAPESAA